jgi:hypothetical protein
VPFISALYQYTEKVNIIALGQRPNNNLVFSSEFSAVSEGGLPPSQNGRRISSVASDRR